MSEWLMAHPEVRTIRVAASDLNGQPRGKRIPTRFAGKVESEGTRFPISALNLDIWGEDIEDSPLVFEAGDLTRGFGGLGAQAARARPLVAELGLQAFDLAGGRRLTRDRGHGQGDQAQTEDQDGRAHGV